MHRFYLPSEEISGKVISLRESDAYHAFKVLRIATGDSVTVLDGSGGVYECKAASTGKREFTLQVIKKDQAPPRKAQITLFQAIPKAKLMDAIIQKSTELGAFRIVPLLTDRVATQLSPTEARDKAEKYRVVAIEALKQSGNPWLPHVDPPVPLVEALQKSSGIDLQLVGSLQPNSSHAGKYFGPPLKSISAWIGPEGDFTEEEISQIVANGAYPITLGPLVLRCETAAIYLLSVINHELFRE